MKFHWVHGILSNLWGFVVETPRVTNAPLGLTRLCTGPSSQAGGPHTITHLLCSSMFDCLSRDTSGLRLLSLLVMLQMWLLSSCSPCLLLCTSAFSFFSSCSSLRSRKQAVNSAVVTPVSSVVFRQFFLCLTCSSAQCGSSERLSCSSPSHPGGGWLFWSWISAASSPSSPQVL